MPHILVRQQYDDFDTWKAAFDGQARTRANASCVSTLVMRNDEDPHEVLVLLEFEDLGEAGRYMGADELSEAWARGGVRSTSEVLTVKLVDTDQG